MHAASGNADAFKHNLGPFQAAGYRAIAYDRKNVARSSNTLRDDALGRPRGVTVQDLGLPDDWVLLANELADVPGLQFPDRPAPRLINLVTREVIVLEAAEGIGTELRLETVRAARA